MVRDLVPNEDVMRLVAASGFSTATDLADWLVRTLKMPFRDAQHVAGALVALAEKQGCDLPELKLEDMQNIEKRITKDVYKVLTVEASVASRTSFGGTAPVNVAREAKRWLKLLK
jgi:argininosuccinate lyase